ncbi:efflux RND transporter permease subunit [Aurantibacillus circumpalustris]|uniref:efflux RND transporter permease subunit n=1 Tax=Aurantibacillus circumpalustris TaxID=3036359 RepID=UPI00295B4A97|nr:efflux RND transporter permease subunit [Aurantibacillus circumpalustris]
MLDKIKEFKPSSWAIDNKMTVYLITIFICIAGIMSYNSLPKENFPDITVPTIFISTVNGGNSPTNIENTITKPIEKRLKSISGVKKFNSTSLQDVSVIVVEFRTDVKVEVAKQKVKDAVDEARADMPQTLTKEPMIKEIAFSEIPIMYINVAGNYDLKQLKKYAEDLQDRIEGLKEINEVKIVGALDREIQVNIDAYKMQAAQLTFYDISSAISRENLSITGGNVPLEGMKPTLSIKGEFKDPKELENIIISSASGAKLFLRDIAEVKDGFKEKESYSSKKGKNVITLNIIKRSGENLIDAADKIKGIIAQMEKTDFPKGLDITVSGDQSAKTKTTLQELINTIIIGFILVTIVLMFFMGVTNALFVALSVPLSMFIAFMIMPSIGFSFNMIVLFAFLLALGIVVDDAIVVIENTHRLFANGKRDIKTAAKMAAGEVFLPVLSGTITTLAPFIPLAFWSGIIGKFMYFLPITLIISLLASLFVAYIINPVFAVDFMKSHEEEQANYGKLNKKARMQLLLYGVLALFSYLSGSIGIGNFIVFLAFFLVLHRLWLYKAIEAWQFKIWPNFVNAYVKVLEWCLRKPWRPVAAVVGLFFFSIFFFVVRSPSVVFFPQGDPNNVYVYVKLPEGTDPAVTNEMMRKVESKVYSVIDENDPVVESMISNVTIGVTDPQDGDQNSYPNKGKIAINFVEFEKRHGKSTSEYLTKLQGLNWELPGAEIAVNKEQSGPPQAKPITVEVSGDDFQELVENADAFETFLKKAKVEGVDNLKSDFVSNKPEIVFDIDRERAQREGLSTSQVAMEIRSAVYGNEATKFRDVDDEYPVNLRFEYNQRRDIETIRNLKITYRDMNMGGAIRSVPISAVSDIRYDYTYAGIKRKNNTRLITLSADVKEGYNANEVAAKVKNIMKGYQATGAVNVKFAGQDEEQAETMAFLGRAMMIAIGLMLLVLVGLFNSLGKPLIILSEILFSIIGVLLGVAVFKMDMSIIMTGVGIIALGGIVVRNGILLVEFAEFAREGGMNLYDATVEAGRTRMTPVILTAIAAVLGLIPLAVGLNINFETLFTHLNPHIFFGGDSVVFWGPLSWTMIFGLIFATILTLLLIPSMYLIAERLKRKSVIILKHFDLPTAAMYIPFLILVLRLILYIRGRKLDYGNLDY